MKYKALKKDDTPEEIERKLQVYGYPLQVYREFIFFVSLENVPFSPGRKRKLGNQIKKLEPLKTSILKRLNDIELDIYSAYGIGPEVLKKFQEPKINSRYDVNGLIISINKRIQSLRTERGEQYSDMPKKRKPKTLDYIIGATLSYILKDGRGARWNDIYELLRFMDQETKFVMGEGPNLLHHESYTRLNLEEGAKKIKKTYPEYIETKKERFLNLSKEPIFKVRT